MAKKFTHKIGDTTVKLPSLTNLPLGVVRRSRNVDDAERLFITFETLFADDSPEMKALDTLDQKGLQEFMLAWAEFSGVSLGEYSAS